MTGDFKASQAEIAEDIMNWMKTHTLRDLTDIALEIEERGDDAQEVWAFIRELKGITTNETIIAMKSSGIAVKEPAQA